MSDYVTDPELLKQLNGETAPPSADQGYITDPELLAQLQSGAVQPEGTAGMAGAVAPAITGAAYATPTGLPQLAKDVYGAVAPVASNAVKNAVAGYAKNPVGAVADAVLMHGGLPPVYGAVKSAQGGYNAVQAAKEVASNLSEIFSQQPANIQKAVDTLSNKLGVEGTTAFQQAYEKNVASVGDKMKAAQQTIKEFKLPDYAANSKVAQEALTELQQGFKPVSALEKIGKVFGPIARGAGRVLGPAGMAMNVYDAANVASETQLGERLARGEGQQSQQAFNNMLNQNTSGYQPNAQEAKNLLDSGDERTINIYGGRKKLQAIANPNAFNSGFAQQLKTMGR